MRHLITTALALTALSGCAGAQLTPPPIAPPTLPEERAARQPERAVGLAAGARHTCAVYADGHVACWGDNRDGQLGVGFEAGVEVAWSPLPVEGLTEATRVVAGFRHACALDASGGVWCWGENARRQLGDGTTSGRAAPVRVELPGPARALTARGDRTCAQRTDSNASWCWGDGHEVAPSDDPLAATSGTRRWHLDHLGQLRDRDGQTRSLLLPRRHSITRGTLFAEVVSGQRHACMRTEDGAVWCAGDNTVGQLGLGTQALGEVDTPTELPRLTCLWVERSLGGRFCLLNAPYIEDASGPSRHGRFYGEPTRRTWRHGPAIEVDPRTGLILARGAYTMGVRTGRWDVWSLGGRLHGSGELTGGDLDAREGYWEFALGEERQRGRYDGGHPVGEWTWAQTSNRTFEATFDDDGEQTGWRLEEPGRSYGARISGQNLKLNARWPQRGWGSFTNIASAAVPDPWTPGVANADGDGFGYPFDFVAYVRDALDI
jgi:hypothetical protein